MKPYTDQQMENSIANMLRIGVTLSALVVLFGGSLYLAQNWSSIPNYRQFNPSHSVTIFANLRSIPNPGLLLHDPPSIVACGILLIIATPVVRVIFCIIGFARQRDRLYVAVSLTVLAILTFSLIQSSR